MTTPLAPPPPPPPPPTADPPLKSRAYVFFDGQNLFHDAQRAFGCAEPDFCPFRLADLLCRQEGWDLRHVRFYTGVPREDQSRTWSVFWANKGAAMKRLKVKFVTRKLSRRTTSVKLYDGVSILLTDGTTYNGRLAFADGREVPDGVILEVGSFAEKGIDVRVAVDVIRYFAEGTYDIGVLFSRDRDLAEAIEEVKRLSRASGTAVTLASAYPSMPGATGVPGTRHLPFDQAFYDQCRDPNTHKYFPKK